MDARERFVRHRVQEEWLWLRLNVDPHASEEDALAYLRSQCGYVQGDCQYARSEYCRLDCPLRPEEMPC